MTTNDLSPGHSGVAKVMSILKAFTGDQTELSLTEVIDRTGLPSSTAHRGLQDLVTQGALVRLPSGRYCLGRLIWEIGTRCPHTSILREIAMPFLQDLYQMTRGHVQLAMPAGDEALILERLSKNLTIKPVGRVGGRIPLHATGAGKVLLAYATADVRKRILNRTLTRYTNRTVTSPQRLKAELETVRERSYATCHGERTAGINSYAVPIFEHGSDCVVVASISVLVGVGPREADGLLDALRPAAQQITRALRKTSLSQSFDGV